MGGEDIKYEKNPISNIFYADIDVHIRKLIAEFPSDGIKCIENCKHIVKKWPFLTKVYMTEFSGSHT